MRVGCREMAVLWGTKAAPAVETHESAATVLNFMVILFD